MSTRVITFRLDTEGDAGKIFTKWEEAGYSPRRIIETALLYLEGIEPQPQYEAGAATLAELQIVVNRLEAIVRSVQQNGGVVTDQHQQEIEEVFDPQFVQGMKRVVRPGFSQRPNEE